MENPIYIIDERLKATDGKRFVGCIIDFFFVYIASFIFGLVIVIIGNIFNLDVFSIWETIIINYTYSALFAILLFNYLLLESLLGRSIGKICTGTIVVNKNGLKPSFNAIFIRTLCRLIPFDVFSFLGKSGRFWHDSLSKTYVVVKNDLEKDMEIFYKINLIGNKEVI